MKLYKHLAEDTWPPLFEGATVPAPRGWATSSFAGACQAQPHQHLNAPCHKPLAAVVSRRPKPWHNTNILVSPGCQVNVKLCFFSLKYVMPLLSFLNLAKAVISQAGVLSQPQPSESQPLTDTTEGAGNTSTSQEMGYHVLVARNTISFVPPQECSIPLCPAVWQKVELLFKSMRLLYFWEKALMKGCSKLIPDLKIFIFTLSVQAQL